MEDVKPTIAELRRSLRTRSSALIESTTADAPSTPKRIKVEPEPESERRVESMLSVNTVMTPGPSRAVPNSRGQAKKETKVKIEFVQQVVVKQEIHAEASGSSGGSRTHGVVKEEKVEAGPSGSQTTAANVKLELDAKPDVSEGKGKEKENEKKPRVKKEVVPKRPMRWRKTCPVATRERLGRVMAQRMFLLDRSVRPLGARMEEFKILGSTGNVYTVSVGSFPTCDCPDARNGNIPCKHIIFVFIKVLKIVPSSELWYQRYLTDGELDVIFSTAPPALQGSSEVPARARAAWLKASGQEHLIPEADREPEAGPAKVKETNSHRKDAVGDDCPVCYEEMSEDDVTRGLLVWDDGTYGCGRALHTQCFRNWSKSLIAKEGAGAAITCVFCRGVWPTPAPAVRALASTSTSGAGYTSNGYLNIAELVGISRKRDTSSYYWGPMAGRRMDDPRYEDD